MDGFSADQYFIKKKKKVDNKIAMIWDEQKQSKTAIKKRPSHNFVMRGALWFFKFKGL